MSSSNNPPILGKPAIARFTHVQVGESYDLSPQRIKADEDNQPHIKLQRELEAMRAQWIEQTRQQTEEMVRQAQQEANTLVSNAKAEANQLISDAVTKAEAEANASRESIREAAEKEGFEKGYADGYQQGHDQVSDEAVNCLASSNAMLDMAYEARRHAVKGIRKKTAHLMQRILERIVTQAWQAEPGFIMDVLDKAMDSLEIEGKVQVVINAEAYQILRQWSGQSAEALERMKRFEWVMDHQLGLTDMYVIGELVSADIGPVNQCLRLVDAITPQLPMDNYIELEESALDTDSAVAEPDALDNDDEAV